ncbi:Co2+/Mg2+ efflux protein ApaG [Pseudotenacibaculum sp. MALMAid0570]|uniref:Co2+/Mg2+ efflux protein ApaG n=1 Tax=Pseudotenacibaculum sp. MALMAid0570 TaxID=3143938 RepID=UPI0032DEF4D1
MVQQITKGIKISVKAKYDGTLYRNYRLYHNFSYYITIENKSLETVQLTDRFWKIFDSLNTIETVEGEGVVGQTPILEPQDTYKYKSGCFLLSNIGAMSGFYTMVNTETQKSFDVTIPTFQLSTPISLN